LCPPPGSDVASRTVIRTSHASCGLACAGGAGEGGRGEGGVGTPAAGSQICPGCPQRRCVTGLLCAWRHACTRGLPAGGRACSLIRPVCDVWFSHQKSAWTASHLRGCGERPPGINWPASPSMGPCNKHQVGSQERPFVELAGSRRGSACASHVACPMAAAELALTRSSPYTRPRPCPYSGTSAGKKELFRSAGPSLDRSRRCGCRHVAAAPTRSCWRSNPTYARGRGALWTPRTDSSPRPHPRGLQDPHSTQHHRER
jgi:hypothetical protein